MYVSTFSSHDLVNSGHGMLTRTHASMHACIHECTAHAIQISSRLYIHIHECALTVSLSNKYLLQGVQSTEQGRKPTYKEVRAHEGMDAVFACSGK